MFVVSGYCAVQLRRGGLDDQVRGAMVANLLAVAAIWLRTNKPVEGDVFVILSTRHGITAADLLSLLPLALAAWAAGGLTQSGRVLARLKRR